MDKELPFWIIFRDVWEGSSSLAKAALKKVAFERQLADGLEHLVILFLQVFLLSLSCLVLRICAERAMGMLAVDTLAAVLLRGERPSNIVNPEVFAMAPLFRH